MSRMLRHALLLVGLLLATQCAHQPEKPADNLPPLRVDPFAGLDSLGVDETQAFTFRKGPAPPPDVSERVKLAFPPPPAPGRMKPPSAPELKVLRTQPSGENELVGAVTASFNQPMVPVAALDELRSKWDAPLVITPRPEGRFRWLGTSTVTFEPKGRMPFATRYEIRIPAGTRALSGRTLEKETRFSFSTPRVELASALPYRHSNQNKPDTPLALLFNQRVDPRAALAALALRGGQESVELALVPRSEWGKLRYLAAGVATWEPERTVVLRPARPLALATSYTLTVRAGLKGEGPLPTTNDLHHSFATYGPLKVDEIRCGDSEHCDPEWGLSVSFTNPLVTGEEELARLVTVTPAPADLELKGSGTYFTLRGSFKPRSRVTVAIARGMKDVHGQELVEPARKELKTGDLHPALGFPARGHAVMEARGDRKVPLEVQSVTSARLRLVKVQRDQLPKVIELARYSYDDDGKRDPLKDVKGLVVTRTLKTGVRENGRARIGLSTDEGLGKGRTGVLYLELKSEELRRFDKWANLYRGLVVNVTDLGLMARYDHDRIVAMVTALESGKPLAGVRLELRDRKGEVVWQGKTGADGSALAPGRRELKGQPGYVLWAERGRDVTFLQLEGGNAAGYLSSYTSWGYAPAKKRLKMFLFTDRNPYRPGETVHLKGVLRQEDTTPEGGIEALPASVRVVKLRVESPRGNKLVENKEVKVTPSGAFSVDVPVPVGADLGHYNVYVVSVEGSAYGSFQVEEYRAPEFEVKVETGAGPFFLGETLKARAGADYLFGAPMAGAEVRYTVRREEASFRPPRNDDFSFGEAVPTWWRFRWDYGRRGGRYGGYAYGSGAAGSIVKEGSGRLDPAGRIALEHVLRPDDKDRRHGPAAFTLEAEVIDQNRQTIANRKVVTAHPSSLYIGLRPEKSVVKAGEPSKVAAVLCDLDGARVAGTALRLRALQIETKVTTVKTAEGWQYRYESQELEADACELTTAKDPTSCELTLKKPGMYLLRSESKDEKGRLARTTLTLYAYGPGHVPWRLENQSKLELVPDKDRYRPGDVARVLVKSPLRDARGFLTVSRSGMVSHKPIELKGNAEVVEVPISEKHLPELFVGVALARGRLKEPGLGKAAQDLGRPTFAHGELKLPVSIEEKRLRVEVRPAQKAVLPSGTLELALETRDHAGKAAPAEVAVMVVDEGVLALLGYQTPDPLAYFWSSRSAETALADSRDALLKREQALRPAPSPRRTRNGGGRPDAVMQRRIHLSPLAVEGKEAPAPIVAADFKAKKGYANKDDASGGAPRIRSRSVFATTAYYNPSVETDEQGRASLTIKMPDNLTTFRIMAVVVDRARPDRFGRGEARVLVRKPLLLRPSLPRFLSVGDRFEAAVMVHNETDAPGEVDVLVRGRNLKALGPARKRVTIAAHRASEVRFAMAPETAGPARVQFAAVLSGKDGKPETDAVEKQLPVLLPATTEAFATYGMTESSIAQTVMPPRDALPGYGGLEISMSSTALNGLEDSVRYLVDYPFECTEQTASRVLPIFALKEILRDFKIAKLGELAAQKQLSEEGVRKLISYQRWDGGWGMWPGARVSWPYLTAYALFALERAKEAGFKVDEEPLRRGRQFLKRILDYPRSELGEQYNLVAQVISVWALSERKQFERAHLKRLYEKRKELPLFAKVWLMQALFREGGKTAEVKELLRELDNAAVESASAAHFSEIATESLRLLMHSEERTDAIALYALLEVDPDHALLPKLARGLIASRVKGRWSTTQANAYALTALARYYKQVEKVVPDYVASLWLGEEGYLGQAAFKGRQLRVVQQEVPMDALARAGDKQELILSKQGPGKLYYRIGLRYAPKSLRLPPEEQGFALTRSYEPVEDAKDTVVRQQDGSWRIKAGSTVRVRLTVVVPDRRYFVAVLDPLPAGLEAVNLGFATSASSRLGNQLKNKLYDFYSWYAFFAFDHQELRDESVVLFADRLPSGVYEYTYLARATTLGRFVAAPTKAEEMYHPETFGRTATAIVEVK